MLHLHNEKGYSFGVKYGALRNLAAVCVSTHEGTVIHITADTDGNVRHEATCSGEGRCLANDGSFFESWSSGL
jgi:hypothetical protein